LLTHVQDPLAIEYDARAADLGRSAGVIGVKALPELEDEH